MRNKLIRKIVMQNEEKYLILNAKSTHTNTHTHSE